MSSNTVMTNRSVCSIRVHDVKRRGSRLVRSIVMSMHSLGCLKGKKPLLPFRLEGLNQSDRKDI
jgi:hypothetical protein